MALTLAVARHKPWLKTATRSPPGMQPLGAEPWLQRDACFADQMAYRDRLIDDPASDSTLMTPDAADGIASLRDRVLDDLARDDGYTRAGSVITRPDGVRLDVDMLPGIDFLGRLVQEDLLLLRKSPGDAEHRLIAGTLCFPSHWRLSEKAGRPLTAIHGPVPFYAGGLARRVQRLFDMLREDTPLWRANWLLYADAELHAPRSAYAPREGRSAAPAWLRVERQTLLRLPTGDVVFSIKTELSPLDSLSPAEHAALIDALDTLDPAQRAYKGGDALRTHLEAAR
ncbi:MAG: DUF3445 domain-containing protein [Pseudomonadota bacterium]